MAVSSATIALAGGVLIGAGASLLLLLNGRLAGVGGIVAGVFPPSRGDWAWRTAFIAGLLAGGLVVAGFRPSVFGSSPTGLPLLAVAGVVVGLGARVAGGCTSGHGICGVSRLSLRSFAATMTFMATGAAVVALQRVAGVLP